MSNSILNLAYGHGGLLLDIAGLEATLIEPRYPPPLDDEAAAFIEAMQAPIDMPALRDWVGDAETLAVVIPDITRALPTRRLLEWLFAALPGVAAERVTIVSGTGTHRRNTDAEWEQMVGRAIFERYRCVDHDAADASSLVEVGTSRFGYAVMMNRHVAAADRRLLLGFIEPHFMAGFSGGYKAIFPGTAGLDAILHYHNAANIGDPASTWGIIHGNPTQDHVRAGGALLPDCFLINVTLDDRRRITGLFCGEPVAAHDRGCAFCKRTAMVACDRRFDVVVTTNSGYPLDQNLYQAVKGMAAAAEVVAPGGLILMAARCNDGFPAHGNFRRFLFDHDSPAAMLKTIQAPGFRMPDQWQAQKLANVLEHARVGLRSELSDADCRRAHLEPVADLRERIDRERREVGRPLRIGVLPEGPLTIPYLDDAEG